MKIELNTRTKTIKETPTKKEAGKDLNSEYLSIMSMALASKIKEIAKNEGQQNKMIDSIALMIRAFLNGDDYV